MKIIQDEIIIEAGDSPEEVRLMFKNIEEVAKQRSQFMIDFPRIYNELNNRIGEHNE